MITSIGWSLFWLVCASSSLVTRGAMWTKEARDGRASSCDMVFSSDTTKSGIIMSPGYPNPYPPRTRCRYEFNGRGKERVQITFHDFSVPSSGSKKCESSDSDVLTAYVDLGGKMEKMDSFCNDMQPRPLMSNGPRLQLDFNGHSSSRDARGFKAVYTFTENFGITTGKQEPKYPCGFAFYSNETQNGTFTSPNYPGTYPRDTECHYFFNGQPKEKVVIVFHYFDVEGIDPCSMESASDFVEFSNFAYKDRKFPRHCGQLTEFRVPSDKNFFHVTFKSNDHLDGNGFNASYYFFSEEESNTVKTLTSSFAIKVQQGWSSLALGLSLLLVRLVRPMVLVQA